MNIDQKLDHLKKLQKVEAPPFLLTRIRQSIANTGLQKISPQWKLAYAATALVVLVMNAGIYVNSIKGKTSEPQLNTVVKSMGLNTSNEFYHE